MSSANGGSGSGDDIKELASKVQQFLSHQVESNANLSEAAKESLTVATECIEQAYGIQRRTASNDLLNIYRASRSTAAPSQPLFNFGNAAGATNANNQQQQQPGDPAQLLSNIASSLFSQVGSGLINTVASAAASAATGQPQQPQAPTTEQSSSSTSATHSEAPSRPSAPPKTRKRATEAEVLAAESFKNQGNDCMKQDKFKEAYDYYTNAIEIDNNNAIYYANRAAASSKLGNHQAALRDCQESIEIDPNYSKAYGRMGLAYASLENHQKAKEAYLRAVELDPNNESYRNNLAIAEEKLAETQNTDNAGGAGAQVGANMANVLRSMMNNPDVMSLAMRSLQDPRVQSMFGLGGGGAPGGGAPGGGAPGGAGGAPR